MTTDPNALACMVFMKVGYHCDEDFNAIIERKRREQVDAGYFFWGYNGVLCHPQFQIRPFVEEASGKGVVPRLAMSLTRSAWQLQQVPCAREFSTGGSDWLALPLGIQVRGSRYAIICTDLLRVDLWIDLGSYEVATGPKRGVHLSSYIRNRVDKACAVATEHRAEEEVRVHIAYVANVVEPFAVCLR